MRPLTLGNCRHLDFQFVLRAAGCGIPLFVLLLSGRRSYAQTNTGPANISSGTATYTSPNILTNSGNAFVINGSASVTFSAGSAVKLEPGFHATAGTASFTFHAVIATQVVNQYQVSGYVLIGSPASVAGLPVPGATVTLSSQSGTVLATTMTLADGSYSFSQPAGSYTLSASYLSDGVRPSSLSVNVASSNVTGQSFYLAAPANQAVTPLTPVKEYIYLNGVPVAIEHPVGNP